MQALQERKGMLMRKRRPGVMRRSAIQNLHLQQRLHSNTLSVAPCLVQEGYSSDTTNDIPRVHE